jgi:hypothetical protein
MLFYVLCALSLVIVTWAWKENDKPSEGVIALLICTIVIGVVSGLGSLVVYSTNPVVVSSSKESITSISVTSDGTLAFTTANRTYSEITMASYIFQSSDNAPPFLENQKGYCHVGWAFPWRINKERVVVRLPVLQTNMPIPILDMFGDGMFQGEPLR